MKLASAGGPLNTALNTTITTMTRQMIPYTLPWAATWPSLRTTSTRIGMAAPKTSTGDHAADTAHEIGLGSEDKATRTHKHKTTGKPRCS
jgi:hypothetical protein